MRPERAALFVQVLDGLRPDRAHAVGCILYGFLDGAAWVSFSMDLLCVRKLRGLTHRGKRLTLQEGPAFVNPNSPQGVSLT